MRHPIVFEFKTKYFDFTLPDRDTSSQDRIRYDIFDSFFRTQFTIPHVCELISEELHRLLKGTVEIITDLLQLVTSMTVDQIIVEFRQFLLAFAHDVIPHVYLPACCSLHYSQLLFGFLNKRDQTDHSGSDSCNCTDNGRCILKHTTDGIQPFCLRSLFGTPCFLFCFLRLCFEFFSFHLCIIQSLPLIFTKLRLFQFLPLFLKEVVQLLLFEFGRFTLCLNVRLDLIDTSSLLFLHRLDHGTMFIHSDEILACRREDLQLLIQLDIFADFLLHLFFRATEEVDSSIAESAHFICQHFVEMQAQPIDHFSTLIQDQGDSVLRLIRDTSDIDRYISTGHINPEFRENSGTVICMKLQPRRTHYFWKDITERTVHVGMYNTGNSRISQCRMCCRSDRILRTEKQIDFPDIDRTSLQFPILELDPGSIDRTFCDVTSSGTLFTFRSIGFSQHDLNRRGFMFATRTTDDVINDTKSIDSNDRETAVIHDNGFGIKTVPFVSERTHGKYFGNVELIFVFHRTSLHITLFYSL
nr:MAG TPA: hypothetical protein [Caudoviricetes sp.]